MSDLEKAFPGGEGKFVGSVKIGPKGQIVIPKEARDLLNMKTGDTLVLLADASRGIAINKMSYFQPVLDKAFGKQETEENKHGSH